MKEDESPQSCPRCGSDTALVSLRAVYHVRQDHGIEFVADDSVYRFRCRNDSCRLITERTATGLPVYRELV